MVAYYYFNQPIDLPEGLTYLKVYIYDINSKVKYKNEIIEIKHLPIKIDYFY